MFYILILFTIYAQETCEADGTCSADEPLANGAPVDLTISNPCNSQVSVYWQGNGQDHLISDLPAGGSGTINSYGGHTFVVRSQGETIDTFKVTSSKHEIHCPEGFRDESNIELPDFQELGINYVQFLNQTKSAGDGSFHQRVYNFCKEPLDLYWVDFSNEEKHISLIEDVIFSHVTYHTHKFRVKRKRDGKIVAKWKADRDRRCKLVKCGNPCKGHCSEVVKALKYKRAYKKRTGVKYEPYTIRKPTKYHIWDADYLGQEHNVIASHGYCKTTSCAEYEPTSFTLRVISQKPRVFIVDNFLTDLERLYVIELAIPRLGNSTMGNGKMMHTGKTRTSKTAWPGRDLPIIEHIGQRVMEVMQLPAATLDRTECLQVVEYDIGQNYGAHWDSDWEVEDMDTKEDRPARDAYLREPRYATFGIHAQAATSGGGTSFPRAFGGKGIAVEPPSGTAILFYNVLPDGNGDITAEHSGMPVHEGKKYWTNIWIHDDYN